MGKVKNFKKTSSLEVSADSDMMKKKKVSFNLKSQNFKKGALKAKQKRVGKNHILKHIKSELVNKLKPHLASNEENRKNDFIKGKLKRKFNANGELPMKKRKLLHTASIKPDPEDSETKVGTSPDESVGKRTTSQKIIKANFKKFKPGGKEAKGKDIMFMKKKDRKLLRKQREMNKNSKLFERSTKLKVLWEELRQENCKNERKLELTAQCMDLIMGHAKELIYAHDTVRVVECVFGVANEEQRDCIFQEIKDCIIPLVVSKYGKFLLIKILRHGSKEQKAYMMSQFYTNVIKFLRHAEAATVVEIAFNECASASQRSELVQEFYGPSFRFFKESNCSSLKQLLVKEPDQKPAIIQHMKEALSKILQKTAVRHSIVHFVLKEFMVHADNESRSEIIELLRPLVVEMLHTKDGSRAAMYCLWYGNTKDRKAIVKSFKTHVVKIAKEEHGHMVLLALFDCVDDTKAVSKNIISELSANTVELSEDQYGKKVLLYLLCPRDSLSFHPDVVKILQQGDSNPYSKKDPELRRKELKEYIVQPLISLIANHVNKKYIENSFCWFMFNILKHTRGDNIDALKSLARVAATNYSAATKNSHIIEAPGSHFILGKIIGLEKGLEEEKLEESFCYILMEEASPETLRSWTNCNRGCFILLHILETGIPLVVENMKDVMNGMHSKISKKTFKGAKLLLQKLKEI